MPKSIAQIAHEAAAAMDSICGNFRSFAVVLFNNTGDVEVVSPIPREDIPLALRSVANTIEALYPKGEKSITGSRPGR